MTMKKLLPPLRFVALCNISEFGGGKKRLFAWNETIVAQPAT
jgi:hypothetical protein